MKLMSMTDFVLEMHEKLDFVPAQKEVISSFIKTKNYAQFLRKPLTMEMFVVLDTTATEDYFCSDNLETYLDLKEKIFFKGFTISHNNTVLNDNKLLRISFDKNLKIEELVKYSIELTDSAIKQIGL